MNELALSGSSHLIRMCKNAFSFFQNYDDGTTDKPYGHALVAGVERYPKKVSFVHVGYTRADLAIQDLLCLS